MAPKAPLDLDACNDRRFRVYVLLLKNGDLYVGSTALSINARYAQHCDPNHELASKASAKHGVERIETRHCHRRTYATRDAAVRAEQKLAERLRAAHPGLRVHQK